MIARKRDCPQRKYSLIIEHMTMVDTCPPSLKDILLRLLANDHFVEAKALLDKWRATQRVM